MKKKWMWLFMSFAIMCSVILWKPVTASALTVGISEVLLYPSGCLKQFTLNSSNRQGGLAAAYGRYAVHTQNDGYHWDNRYTSVAQNDWSLAETEQFRADTHLVAWGSGDEIEWTRTDIDFAIPICFPDGVIDLNNNATYHVLMWTRSPKFGLYSHPDSLAVLTLGDGEIANNGTVLHTCTPGEAESLDGSSHHYPLCDDAACAHGNNTTWSSPEAHTYPTSGENIYRCSVCGYTDTARQAADQYRSDWAELLRRTSADRGDLAQIEAALAACDGLPGAVKDLLAAEKVKLDDLKAQAEADKAAHDAAAAFRQTWADLLSKTSANKEDLAQIEAALDAYGALSPAVKNYLAEEKAKLDDLKSRAEADQAAADRAEAFRREYAEILGMTSADREDLPVIDQALADYDALPEEVKAYLPAEKLQLEELKAQAEADQAAYNGAEAFRREHEELLAKTLGTKEDLRDIQGALDAYDALPPAVKDYLAEEKAKLDELKAQAEADKAAYEAAEEFRRVYAEILGMTSADKEDLTAIDQVIGAYNDLSDPTQSYLTDEKTKLDDLKGQAEADQAAADAAEDFRRDHEEELRKTFSYKEDLPVIYRALADYAELPEAVKAYLTVEKVKLDDLKGQAEADQAASDAADDFRREHEEILEMTSADREDLTAIDQVIGAYNELTPPAQTYLTEEKAKLDDLHDQAASDQAAFEKAEAFRNKYRELLEQKTFREGDEELLRKALKEFDQLPAEVKAYLISEKAKVNSLKKQMDYNNSKASTTEDDPQTEEMEASAKVDPQTEEMEAAAKADQAAAVAEEFRQEQEELLEKISGEELDPEEIREALKRFEELPEEVKKYLAGEKAKLELLLQEAEAGQAAAETGKPGSEEKLVNFDNGGSDGIGTDAGTGTGASAVDFALLIMPWFSLGLLLLILLLLFLKRRKEDEEENEKRGRR